MFRRYISLYYGSIGFRESCVLFYGLISSIWQNSESRQRKVTKKVNQYYLDTEVYTYSSARGSIAACLNAWEIGVGDKVVISAFTCLAVPTGIIAVGATPVYADTNPLSLNNSEETLISLLDIDVKAVIVQHTMGFAVNFLKLRELAKKKNILIIEDCALSWGATSQGLLLGSLADAAIFSLELSKTISTGWGGVLISRNDKLSKNLTEQYRNLAKPSFSRVVKEAFQTGVSGICQKPTLHWIGKYLIFVLFKLNLFKYSTPLNEVYGNVANDFKMKLGTIQLALLDVQWEKMSKIQQCSKINSDYLIKRLSGFKNFKIPHYKDIGGIVSPRISFYTQDIQVFSEWFSSQGIEVGFWFDGPLSPSPKSERFNYDIESYPNSRDLAQHIVNLPFHNRLTKKDVKKITLLLEGFLLQYPDKDLIWLGN